MEKKNNPLRVKLHPNVKTWPFQRNSIKGLPNKCKNGFKQQYS